MFEDGQYYVTPFGAKILVDGEKGEQLKKLNVKPQEIILGVRPEHIVLAKGNEGIKCTVMVNEMMGSELHLHTTTDDDTHLIVRVPTIGLSQKQRHDLQAGHEFYITFEGKVMHLFDVETENNLLK